MYLPLVGRDDDDNDDDAVVGADDGDAGGAFPVQRCSF